jgi:type VI protein secretion system component Hcp
MLKQPLKYRFMRIYGVLTTLVIALSLVVSLPAYGQDYFLDIPGIPGDVNVVGYEGQVCIKSFSWDVPAEVDFIGGYLRSNSLALVEFQFGKLIDLASPLLFGAVTGGQRHPLLTFSIVLRTDNGVRKLAVYELRDAFFSGYQPGGSRNFRPEEVISLKAEQVKITYYNVETNEELSSYEYNFRTAMGG